MTSPEFLLDARHLSVLDARLMNSLVDPPSPEVAIEQALKMEDLILVQPSASLAVPADYLDRIEFSVNQQFFGVSKRETANVVAELQAIVDAEIRSFAKRHAKLRKKRVQQDLHKKRKPDHFRWLVRRIILRETYAEIASLSACLGEDAIASGVKTSARQLGIELSSLRTKKPK